MWIFFTVLGYFFTPRIQNIYEIFQLGESEFIGSDEYYFEIILLKNFSNENPGFEKVKQKNTDSGQISKFK